MRQPPTQTSCDLSGFRPKIIPAEAKNPTEGDRARPHKPAWVHLNVPVNNHGPVEQSTTTYSCSKSVLQTPAMVRMPREGSISMLFQFWAS